MVENLDTCEKYGLAVRSRINLSSEGSRTL